MPLSGTSIVGAKGLAEGYQPILAYVFEFADGSFLRVATHPLNAAEGGTQVAISGFPHTAQDFLGRIDSQDLRAIQSISEHGIDHISNVGLNLHDPDKFVYQNYERTKGFKGATVSAYLFLYDIEAGTFSSDYETKFVGICNAPSVSATGITITATTKANLQKVSLPLPRIQRRCPWINPRTTAQRAEASNEDSDFYECGETRDLTTAPPCSNTKETCTQPNRFRGITFAPPDRWQSRGYLDGKTIEGANSPNDSKYGESTPMLYGTTWVEPPVMNVVGDANSTRMEAMLCVGNLGGAGTTNPGRVLKVIVNDVEVPFVAYSPDKPIFRWEWVSTGARDGAANMDAGYDGKGDPYGSTAVITICVYRKLAQSETTPRVRVLTGGPDIRVYTDATTYSSTNSSNPVWVLLDVLTWSNLKYADIDLQSFVDVAAKCAATIDYKDFGNVTQSHQRFDCSMAIRERRSAAEVVRGLLRSMNCNLIWVGGKYRLLQRATLAEQQPSTISGSNYNTAVSSKSFAGATVNGYVAYSFSEADYVVGRDGAAEFEIESKPISDSPNRVSFQIQDKHNSWVVDSYTLNESDDIARSKQEVGSGLEVLGVNSYDQAARIANTYLSEIHRGNPRGDTGGTEVYRFLTSVKASHLRLGQIIRVSNAHFGIENQLARIIELQPAKNYETLRIRAAFHSDDWYTDAWGQQRSPAPTGAGSDPLSRPPYPWQPNIEQPPTSDAMYPRDEYTFAVKAAYQADAGGNNIAKITVRGQLPVTSLSSLKPPAIGLQMSSGTGGSLAGGGWQYSAIICGVDADGKITAPSRVASAVIVPAGSSYTLTVDVAQWAPDTAGYRAFLFRDAAMRFAWQASASGTPSTITFSTYKSATWGPPDTEARKLAIRAKQILLHGVWVLRCTAVGTNTLTFDGQAWTTNEWADYTISLVAKDAAGEQKIFNATVTSNTADVLTLAINPSGTALSGDVFVMRPRASVSGSTLTDTKLSMNTNAYKGQELLIVSGPGRGYRYPIASNTATAVTIEGSFDEAVTIDSRWVIVSPNWLTEYAEHDLTGNEDPGQEVSLTLEFPNYDGQSLLFAGFVLGDGKESLDIVSPFREMYLTGATGVDPSAPDAPGPIRNLAVGTIDVDTDPGFALVPVSWDPPTTPNLFDRILFWVSASGLDPVDVGTLPHPVGSAGSGSGTLRIPRPTAGSWTSAILWGASGSATYQNSLITDVGVTQTPNVSLGTIAAAPSTSAGTPTAPTAVSLTIPLDGDTFSLSTSWTPDSPVGGTTKWGREVRYFSDSACTTPDSDWIDLGEVYGDTVTAAVSGPFPRPPADQWVKLRVRGLNWQDEASAWTTLATGVKLDQSTGGYELPNAPSACSVSIVGREETFALQIVITPPSPLGGTAGYDREARFYNDAGLTSPDSDWIPLGWVDDAATTSVTAFWPRPQDNQWVLVRVRATNWNGDVTSWVQSASAAALTPVATPPAIAANTTTIRSKSDNGIPKFGFRVVITEAGSPGSTDWYEVQARFWNDVGLTTPDSEWIPLGGTSRAQLTLDTDYWDRPKATQYAKTRVAGKNANGTLGPWTESTTQTITASSGINAGELDPTSIDGTNFAIVAGVLDLPASAISAFEIASAAVTNAKLAADSVDSSKIQNATIVGGDIAAATIAGSNIANGTILGANIGSATIVSANIQDATIAAIDIASATILGSNIASGTITGANIQDASISGTDIAAATISAANIVAATITAAEIAAATITGSNIADASIFANNIASSTITAAQIANNTVTGAKIADGTITAADMANLTITAAKIQGLTITAAEIADLTINGTKITDSGISNAKVATSTLTGDKLANATITGSKIATATITGTLIQSATIAGSNIASGTITATQIATGTIVATNIANLTITASQIADLTITSGKIASITADKITAGTISATITMTSPVINSPNISVTGSNFSISINTTNAIRVQGTFTGITSTIAANGFAVSDASSYSGTLSPGGLGILGSQGQFSFSAGAFGSLVNNSAQGWTLRPTFFANSASGAYIDLTGFNQYITASQFRYPAGAYGSESLALSSLTTTHVIYAYGPGGFYLGKIPVFY